MLDVLHVVEFVQVRPPFGEQLAELRLQLLAPAPVVAALAALEALGVLQRQQPLFQSPDLPFGRTRTQKRCKHNHPFRGVR